MTTRLLTSSRNKINLFNKNKLLSQKVNKNKYNKSICFFNKDKCKANHNYHKCHLELKEIKHKIKVKDIELSFRQTHDKSNLRYSIQTDGENITDQSEIEIAIVYVLPPLITTLVRT